MDAVVVAVSSRRASQFLGEVLAPAPADEGGPGGVAGRASAGEQLDEAILRVLEPLLVVAVRQVPGGAGAVPFAALGSCGSAVGVALAWVDAGPVVRQRLLVAGDVLPEARRGGVVVLLESGGEDAFGDDDVGVGAGGLAGEGAEGCRRGELGHG